MTWHASLCVSKVTYECQKRPMSAKRVLQRHDDMTPLCAPFWSTYLHKAVVLDLYVGRL